MSRDPFSGYQCQACGAGFLHELNSFRALPRVTSDANPWPAGGRLFVCFDCGTTQKIADAQWRAEIAHIYERYAIYHQSCGAEQPIFSGHADRALPRSVLIAEYIESVIPLSERASMLDFGCGNGSALRTFSQRHPQWRLYGAELNDTARERLAEIANFVKLYTGELARIDETFDLITLIHSLEHVIGPERVLSDILKMAGAKGHVFVQVPNCTVTPYDLLIADHLTHFSLDSLCLVGSRAGYRTIVASDSVLPKELSWIGKVAEAQGEPKAPMDSRVAIERVGHQLAWLHAQANSAKEIARSSAKFGVFGTSISGTWLASVVGERVEFFVDEDPGRIGREHMGAPIVSPESVDCGSDIYVPLIPKVGNAVAMRLQRPGLRYHTPPDLAS